MIGIHHDNVIHLDHTASTNDDAFAVLGQASSCLVWTTDQRAGRGSRGREWLTPRDHGLALSLGLHSEAVPSPGTWCYPLFAGVLLFDALASLRPEASLSLKWPNDVLFENRKLAGILCESRWSGSLPSIVLGMGVNLKHHQAMDDLPKSYAALSEWPEPPSPLQVVDAIKVHLGEVMSRYTDAEALNAAWLSRSALSPGQGLRLHAMERDYTGTFVGLDAFGCLLLRDATGTVHQIQQSCDDFQFLG
ncbi:Biotin--[acetyl-CoA-carboxylase] ligase [Sulfidibacter corallicola]|uniref:Biotin--[acetyl-CoA-carboxylase] ligase n=1 Tax=Sulfidibacter corallicola TaxID=2818388 RepID=A0A8A4TN00_SULCO|nr:biotin--[acetyl-CoA-carboxylase] ligase [Sulfidibacter corallicola]QTD50298.1 biotin--[acetyl-CoA-carboxylase] ligase [Sulfidibacter corallicola]